MVQPLSAFLDDETSNMEKTRAFLDRRLQDVAKIPKATKPLRTVALMVGSVASQIFSREGVIIQVIKVYSSSIMMHNEAKRCGLLPSEKC